MINTGKQNVLDALGQMSAPELRRLMAENLTNQKLGLVPKPNILGFIFYKYLSDKLVSFAEAEEFSAENFRALTQDDAETVAHFKSNLGYFIAHKHLFSTGLD